MTRDASGEEEEEEEEYKDKLTCVVIGDSRVGKSSFIQRATGSKEVDATNSYNCYSLATHLDSKSFTLDLWDTRSNNGVRNLQWSDPKPGFTPRVKADVALLMFSCSFAPSFKNIDFFADILHKIGVGVPVILCCTKIDERNKSSTTSLLGIKKAKKIQAVAYVECSSVTGVGISEVIHTIIREAQIKRNTKQIISPPPLASTYFSLFKSFAKLPTSYLNSPYKSFKFNTTSIVEGALLLLTSTFMLTKLLDDLSLPLFLSLRLLCTHVYTSLENSLFWLKLCDRYVIFYVKTEVKLFKSFFVKNYVKTATYACVPEARVCKLHDYS